MTYLYLIHYRLKSGYHPAGWFFSQDTGSEGDPAGAVRSGPFDMRDLAAACWDEALLSGRVSLEGPGYEEWLDRQHRLVVRWAEPRDFCQQPFFAIDWGRGTPCLHDTYGRTRHRKYTPDAPEWDDRPALLAQARQWARGVMS